MAKFNFYLACIVAAFVAQGLAAPSYYGDSAAPAGAEATPCETADATGAAVCVPATVVATTYVTSTCTEATTATTTTTVTQATTVMETVTSASVVAITSTCTETASTTSTVTVPTYTTTTLYVCPDCAPNAVGTEVAETPCETSTSPYEETGSGDGAGAPMTTEAPASGSYAAPTETAAPAEATQYASEQQDSAAGMTETDVTETTETAGEPLPVEDAGVAGGDDTTLATGTETSTEASTEASTETSTETATETAESAAAASPAYVEPIYDGAAQSSSATNYRRRRRV